MQAGAFGLSSGLVYWPGCWATTDELVALARVAARYGGIYASHIAASARPTSKPLRRSSPSESRPVCRCTSRTCSPSFRRTDGGAETPDDARSASARDRRSLRYRGFSLDLLCSELALPPWHFKDDPDQFLPCCATGQPQPAQAGDAAIRPDDPLDGRRWRIYQQRAWSGYGSTSAAPSQASKARRL